MSQKSSTPNLVLRFRAPALSNHRDNKMQVLRLSIPPLSYHYLGGVISGLTRWRLEAPLHCKVSPTAQYGAMRGPYSGRSRPQHLIDNHLMFLTNDGLRAHPLQKMNAS
jgi:hypothetical protein